MTSPTAATEPSPDERAPLRVAVLNDYDVIVLGVAAMLSRFPGRVAVVDWSVGDATVREPVDIALFDRYGRKDFAEPELAQLVADGKVGAVVVFTNSMPPSECDRLVALGVSGCLSKSLSAAELVDELERVASGERRVSTFSELGDPVVADATAPGGDWGLSYRESEVLALLSQGLRNKEIAAALYIGTETVKSHLTAIFQKMGVSSRGEAIAIALRNDGMHRR